MILNEEKVNDNYDKYLKIHDIRIYSNEHGDGHLELKTVNKSYFVYIPSAIEWKNSKTIKPLVSTTKPHKITSDLSKDLILWFGELSKTNNNDDYTNIEYCRFYWNSKNIDTITKTFVKFKPVKDYKLDENDNEIKPKEFRNVGWIKIEILEDSKIRFKFKYENNIYVLVNGKILPQSKFLQDLFDKYY